MTLEELKAAWEAAKAKAEADSENAELKAAAEAAKAAYDAKAAEAGADDDSDPDESKLDAKTQKYIEKLRKEAAKHRVDAKDVKSKLKAEEEKRKAILKAAGIETEDDVDPAEKLKMATAETQNLAFRNAILESALQHGISGDDLEYYEFLVAKEASALQDDEELSEEKMTEIVGKVKKAKGGSANTSVGNGKGKGGKTPSPDSSDEMTLDKFTKLNMSEKGLLFEKNPELYKTLVGEARSKNRLI